MQTAAPRPRFEPSTLDQHIDAPCPAG